jgi:diaminohydroxyphosphoribosylaminopyrimidine deaminase / 5-amino-6-(5-phosphoribosylamino)uracil reductase
MIDQRDEEYMRRCLQLALNGKGTCSPNPMVGAILVRDGKIIGEGWHKKAGEPHAEPNAINSVKNQDLLKESTLYVSLEPCSHYGKTPPCVDLIIKKNIPRVVIGTLDPFPEVSGRGVARLKAAGVDVTVGVESDACLQLNKSFFTFFTKKRPYVILKWAQTRNGFIDYKREPGSVESPLIISSPFTKMLTHKLRSENDVILVGTRTALLDNPKLNVRDWSGNTPVRAVVDRNLVLNEGLYLFDGAIPTLVFTEKSKNDMPGVSYITIDFNSAVSSILNWLYQNNYQRLLVEGGALLHEAFLKAGLWDEIHIETSEIEIPDGVSAPDISGLDLLKVSEDHFGETNSLRTLEIFKKN